MGYTDNDPGMGASIAYAAAQDARQAAADNRQLIKDHEDRLLHIERVLQGLGQSFNPPPEPLNARIAELPEGSVVATREMVFIATEDRTADSGTVYRWLVGNNLVEDATVATTYGAEILRIGKETR